MGWEITIQQSGAIEVVIPDGVGPVVQSTTIITDLVSGPNVISTGKSKMPRIIQIWDSSGYLDTIKPSLMVDESAPFDIHIWVTEAITNVRFEIIHY